MNTTQLYNIWQTSSKNEANKDYYTWEIWLEDGDMAISSIEKVEYLLHPTFPNRLLTSTSREQNFKIKSSGWGEFLVNVIIYDKPGNTHNLSHWLILRENYNNGGKFSLDQNSSKTVFLSYANSDTKFAKQVEFKLSNLGFNIKSHSNIAQGVSVEEHIKNSISSSDAVIAIIPEEDDPWQREEMEIAKKAVVNTFKIEDHKKRGFSKLKGASGFLDKFTKEDSIESIVNQIRKI